MPKRRFNTRCLLILVIIKLSIINLNYNPVFCQQATDHNIEPAAHETEADRELASANESLLVRNVPTAYFEEFSVEENFDQRISFDQYLDFAMRSLSLVAGFDNDLHRYDKRQDLINSFARNYSLRHDELRPKAPILRDHILEDQSESIVLENELNQLECGRQLARIIDATQKLFSGAGHFSRSTQLGLIEFMDSFGAPSSQTMKGNFMWLGSPEQCRQSKLPAVLGASVDMRYCVANLRSPSWPMHEGPKEGSRQRKSGSSSIKLGVCLPKSCNSLSYSRHSALVESLIKLTRLQQAPYSDLKLVHLFCLPDEGSPLRQFSLSAQAFVVLLTCWLTAVFYFSLKYEYQRMKWLSQSENSPTAFEDSNTNKVMSIFAFRSNWSKLFSNPSNKASSGIQPKPEEKLSVSNMRVFSTGQMKNYMQENCAKLNNDANNNNNNSNADSVAKITSNMLASLESHQISTKEGRTNLPPLKPPTIDNESHKRSTKSTVVMVSNHGCNQVTDRKASVDLSCIDGIKVLSMIWLISGHTLMFFIRNIANGRDFWTIMKDARFLTIVAGIFPVDTFFTITGILTSFNKFSKNNGQDMSKLSYWQEAFLHRYLRFMPMYLIVFWYTRDVSQYIGSGPLWDYATADTSLRSTCSQESFSVPLLFQANFKPLDQHCVKPAWYLANDYQFLLLTPVFMGLLMKSTLLGYSAIGLSILFSLFMQFLTVYQTTDMDDFGAIINFKPMFGAYLLMNLWKLYVLPYNRIPPYLIGLITGHMMYKLRLASDATEKQPLDCSSKLAGDREPNNLHNPSPISPTATSHHASTEPIMVTGTDRSRIGHLLNPLSQLKNYLCLNVWLPLFVLISIIYLPMISRVMILEGWPAKIGTSSVIAVMRFVWSLAIARLIYVCATRFFTSKQDSREKSESFVIRFLGSPKWKPWSKIGLSALLIQWEIIEYLAQIQTRAPDLTISFTIAIILFAIFATYVLAVIIYLTIEYPLSQVEQLYVRPAMISKS